MARATSSRVTRTTLRLLDLEDRAVPAFLSGAEIAVGADAGSPAIVRLLDPSTGSVKDSVLAFDDNFYGGVRVAVGDVTGDGHPDLIVAAGPGGGPVVKVFDGQTGAATAFFAFDPSFTGGINVAVGDVTGDGVDEIIVGAGAGGGPAVKVFDGAGDTLQSFFAYEPGVRSGVRVAAGDVTGDGTADIVTGPGFGGGPDVRVFDLAAAGGTVQKRAGFFAYDPTFLGGVSVDVADVTGDGKAEIVTGAGAGGGPVVGVFDGTGGEIRQFFAYDPSFRGGVRVGSADLTGDGRDEVITAPGTGGGSQVNVYDGTFGSPLVSAFAFPTSQLTGSFVAGSSESLAVPGTALTSYLDAYAPLRQKALANQPVIASAAAAGALALSEGAGLYGPLGAVYGPSFFGNPAFYGTASYLTVPGVGSYDVYANLGNDPLGAFPLIRPIVLPAPPGTPADNTPNPPTGNVDSSNGDVLGSNNDSSYVPSTDPNTYTASYTPSTDGGSTDSGSTDPGNDSDGGDCGCGDYDW